MGVQVPKNQGINGLNKCLFVDSITYHMLNTDLAQLSCFLLRKKVNVADVNFIAKVSLFHNSND